MTFEDSIKSELRPSSFPACFAGEIFEAVSMTAAVKVSVSTAKKIHDYDIELFKSIATKFCKKEFGQNSQEKLDQLLKELI